MRYAIYHKQKRYFNAFGTGLYYGITGLRHTIKKPAGSNEKFAMVADMIIFMVWLVYFIMAV